MLKNSLPTTVVLIHGWGGSYESVWEVNGWAERLRSAGFNPIGIDLPGHGSASRSHDPLDYADLSSDVIKRLPDDKPLLAIGYSLGCKVLLEIEARMPGRFSRLVLGGLGGNVFAPESLGVAVASCLEQGIPSDAPPVVKALAEYGISSGNDALAIAACLRRTPNPELTPDRLSGVRCPVLLVAGDADTVAYPMDRLADALSDSLVATLPGVNHLNLPADGAFIQAAISFLYAKGV